MIRRHRNMFLLLAVVAPVAQGQQWQVLSREDGCLPIAVLFRRDKPADGRTPRTPQEYAELMRSRGNQPRLAPVDGLPPEMREKVIQVRVREGLEPVFVREEICRNLGKGAR